MLDHLDDIESDLSVFHRIDDPMALGSSRYFRLVERLHHYDGAVRAARRPRTVEAPPAPVVPQLGQPGMGGERPVVLDDVRTVAALTHAPGMPGIEYVPGG